MEFSKERGRCSPSHRLQGGVMVSIKDLKDTDLFKGLSVEQLKIFERHLREEQFQAREVIFAQGATAQNLYILLEGEVTLGIKAKGEIDITAYSVGKKGRILWPLIPD